MYFCGLFNIDEWDKEAKYIILDDFDLKFFPHWKQFFGAQKRITIGGKYRTNQSLDWGRPLIFLCNPDLHPRRILSGDQLEWLRSNAVFLELETPLF